MKTENDIPNPITGESIKQLGEELVKQILDITFPLTDETEEIHLKKQKAVGVIEYGVRLGLEVVRLGTNDLSVAKWLEEETAPIKADNLPEDENIQGYYHSEIRHTKSNAIPQSEGNPTRTLTGIEFIAKERQEQIEKHGRTIQHDVSFNTENQLLSAIMMLAANIGFSASEHTKMPKDAFEELRPEGWDESLCRKMLAKAEIDQLVILGALAAAEIDRRINIPPPESI